MLKRLLTDELGAAAVEYGLLAAVLAATLVAMLLTVGQAVDRDMRKVDASVPHRIVVRT